MPPQGQEFGSGILVKLRRLAIRAAKFEPEADYATRRVSEIHSDGISVVEKKRGAIKGAINKDSFAFPIVPFQCLSVPLHSFQVLEIPAGSVFDPHRPYHPKPLMQKRLEFPLFPCIKFVSEPQTVTCAPCCARQTIAAASAACRLDIPSGSTRVDPGMKQRHFL
jgi:hypothetical protein